MRAYADAGLERAVIGAAMAGPTAREDLLAVRPEHFVDPRHAAVWSLIWAMDGQGEAPTPQTVAASLDRIPARLRTGIDPVWVFDAYTAGTPATSAAVFAERLVNLAGMRRLADALSRAGQLVEGVSDASEALELVRGEIDAAQPDARVGGMVGEDIDETLASLAAPQAIYETPWESLNGIIRGWRPGGLYVIGARPGAGKTIAGVQAALALANIGPVALNSLEMGRREIHARILANRTGILLGKLFGTTRHFRGLSREEEAAIVRELDGLRALPLSIDDRSSVSVADVRAHARSLTRHGKLAGVVVDYLQLMTGQAGDRRPRHEIVADQSRQLKMLAKDLDCPVIALSQLNRASETRDSRAPSLADLRESGAIEQDADAVLLLHMPEHMGDAGVREPMLDRLTVTVAKNRQGPQGRVTLARNAAFASLDDIPGQTDNNIY